MKSSWRKTLSLFAIFWHLVIFADELSAMDKEIVQDLDFFLNMEVAEDQELLLQLEEQESDIAADSDREKQ